MQRLICSCALQISSPASVDRRRATPLSMLVRCLRVVIAFDLESHVRLVRFDCCLYLISTAVVIMCIPPAL